MEEILEEISRDATSARLKHLKEACVTANGMSKFCLSIELQIYPIFLFLFRIRYCPKASSTIVFEVPSLSKR